MTRMASAISERDEVGTNVGAHELVQRVTESDVSAQYLARTKHGATTRVVLVDRFDPALSDNESFCESMLEDVRGLLKLRHLNLVTPLECGNERGMFIVSDPIEALTLAELQAVSATEKIPATITVRIGIDMLVGLNAMHQQRGSDGKVQEILHGALEPSAVVLAGDGSARLARLGTGNARAILRAGKKDIGARLGGYLAAELLDGDPLLTRASDTYSAAVIVWELLTGRHLLGGADPAAAGDRKSPVPRASTLVTGLPAKLDDALLRALDPEPGKRFASAIDFSRALETSGLAPAPRTTVATFVSRALKDKLAERREQVRIARTTAPTPKPAAAKPVVQPKSASGIPMPSAFRGSTLTGAGPVGGVALPHAPRAPEPSPVVETPRANVPAEAPSLPTPATVVSSSLLESLPPDEPRVAVAPKQAAVAPVLEPPAVPIVDDDPPSVTVAPMRDSLAAPVTGDAPPVGVAPDDEVASSLLQSIEPDAPALPPAVPVAIAKKPPAEVPVAPASQVLAAAPIPVLESPPVNRVRHRAEPPPRPTQRVIIEDGLESPRPIRRGLIAAVGLGALVVVVAAGLALRGSPASSDAAPPPLATEASTAGTAPATVIEAVAPVATPLPEHHDAPVLGSSPSASAHQSHGHSRHHLHHSHDPAPSPSAAVDAPRPRSRHARSEPQPRASRPATATPPASATPRPAAPRSSGRPGHREYRPEDL